jgi:hypothetical protein
MKTTTSNLIRWAGLSAVLGGTVFVAMQPIHPPETLASVTTPTWAIVHYVGVTLPRWAGGGLAVATVAPLALSLLLPHEFIRLAAVPIGGALVWLEYALWSERRENVSEALVRSPSPQLRPAGAA